MGSSRERRQRGGWRSVAWGALLVALGCSVGHGEGELAGSLHIGDCRIGSYELSPTVFFAESAEQLLALRIQRGSDIEVRSDGLSVLVDDATLLERSFLGQSLPVASIVPGQPRIDLTLYLNETCPAERDKTPVAIAAVSGQVRFTAIYAPEVDKDQVRIAAELIDLHFVDPRTDDRFADLSGSFDFLYVRGSPAQRFP